MAKDKNENKSEETKPRRLKLTCWEESEPYEPGIRVLQEFKDDAMDSWRSMSAMQKAIPYVNDLVYAITDSRFDLKGELVKIAKDISKMVFGEDENKLSIYDLPLSIVNLVLDKYNIELEED